MKSARFVIRTVHFSYIHLENLNMDMNMNYFLAFLKFFLHFSYRYVLFLHFSYIYVPLLYLTFCLTCKTIVRSDISYTFLTHILQILHF
jgi:hypothetical protein